MLFSAFILTFCVGCDWEGFYHEPVRCPPIIGRVLRVAQKKLNSTIINKMVIQAIRKPNIKSFSSRLYFSRFTLATSLWSEY